ncbi:putative oligopeptide transporter, OPT superfamily [Helianthus anomalus]
MMSMIYQEKKWIPLINIPVILFGFAGMLPTTPINIASLLVTGMIFNYFVFKCQKQWWQKYNYVLSVVLDAGTTFMGVLLFVMLQNDVFELKWWGAPPFGEMPYGSRNQCHRLPSFLGTEWGILQVVKQDRIKE